MSLFGLSFGQNADVDIILDNQDERKMAEIKDENGRKERLYLFYDGESVTGKVNVTLHRKTNRLEHQGIKIEFIGQIELYYDRGNHHEFLSLVKELARPGELTQNTSFEFEFNQVEKPYECYTGANVRLRYFLRVTIVRRLTDMTKEMDLLVHTLATYPEMNNPIKMEVGIEECLHIEFEYNKSKYHLKDVIVGKIYFLLVRIKIRHMEVAIIKRETTGSGPNTFHDNETIAKYEIMDGAPVKGESIPIRVFLAGYDLTPTMRDINKKFSVRYYLNLVLVDEEERRYFKQQEITLWRKGDRPRKSLMLNQGHPGYHQIPHAMARHTGGDMPSANVRTAPTPSEPNTPVAMPNNYGGAPGGGGPPIPGSAAYVNSASAAGVAAGAGIAVAAAASASAASTASAIPNSSSGHADHNRNAIPEKPESRGQEDRLENDDQLSSLPEADNPAAPETQKQNDLADEESSGSSKPAPAPAVVRTQQLPEEQPEKPPAPPVETEKKADANLNTASSEQKAPASTSPEVSKNDVEIEAEAVSGGSDDRELPPEDDSVPDMENSLEESNIPGIVDNDEEDEEADSIRDDDL